MLKKNSIRFTAVLLAALSSFVAGPNAALPAAPQHQLLLKLAREDVLIAGPHMNFPAMGRLRKEGSEYRWAPVVFTDQWDTQAPSPQKW